MTLEQLAALSTIAQAVLVVVSLIFIWLQVRQNTELAKAANAQALVEHAGSFNAMLIQDKELTRLWYSYGKGLEKSEDKLRYRDMVVQWLIFHENIYYQYNKKLLDARIFNSWNEELKAIVNYHNLEIITPDLEAFFPGGFGRHLIELAEAHPNKAFSIPSIE
jgi:hypothetical protein